MKKDEMFVGMKVFFRGYLDPRLDPVDPGAPRPLIDGVVVQKDPCKVATSHGVVYLMEPEKLAPREPENFYRNQLKAWEQKVKGLEAEIAELKAQIKLRN